MAFDIGIVGGGITGVGVAIEARRQGYSVVLIERGEILQGASGNSLRIIHGGLRYLQSMDLLRSLRSIADQRDVLREVPGMRQLRCVMPFGEQLPQRVAATGASLLYRSLMMLGGSPVSRPRVITLAEDCNHPALTDCAGQWALEWWDVLIDDLDRAHQYLRAELERLGVTLFVGAGVTSAERAGGTWQLCTDRADHYQARILVNCSGSAIGTVRSICRPRPDIDGGDDAWCVAMNVVLNHPFAGDIAVARRTRDGRALFAVPRGSGTALGTWYGPIDGTDIPPECELDRLVDDFLSNAAEAYPGVSIGRASLLAIDRGVLPRARKAKGVEAAGRDQIRQDADYLEVLSTKYTTYQSLARRVLRIVGAELKPQRGKQ